MRYSIEIGKIIEGALKNDSAKVVNYTNQLIEKLKNDGEINTAEKFSKILTNKNNINAFVAMEKLNPIPVDSESRSKLVDIYYDELDDVETVLNSTNEKIINEFIINYKNSSKLIEAGLETNSTILMYGPPGCGKTNCARMIAKKVGLPLVVARLDSLISSYLGTTAKNIRTMFEYIQKNPCVLFLDEFDAIAKARDDNNELGELKRVVNSLLQNIDALSDCIVIAATNHEKLLDDAIWRRFNYKMFIDYPDTYGIVNLIKIFSKSFIQFNQKELEQLAICFNKKSGSYIKDVLENSFRRCIVNDDKITINVIFNQILLNDNVELASNKEKVKYFLSKNTDNKYFTYDDIANILGITKGYVSILARGE